MPDVRLTPNQLRNFANRLDQTATAIRDRKSDTDRKFHDLHSTWRDDKYSQFEKIFTETEKQLDEFLRRAAEFSRHLRNVAAKADKYREHRY
jgi:uncharacterized protein YukE